MKENNLHTEFEEIIKNKFSDGVEAPDDLLWKRLNDQLLIKDEQVRRKGFLFYILGSLMILFVVSIVVFSNLPNIGNHQNTNRFLTKFDEEIKSKQLKSIKSNAPKSLITAKKTQESLETKIITPNVILRTKRKVQENHVIDDFDNNKAYSNLGTIENSKSLTVQNEFSQITNSIILEQQSNSLDLSNTLILESYDDSKIKKDSIVQKNEIGKEDNKMNEHLAKTFNIDSTTSQTKILPENITLNDNGFNRKWIIGFNLSPCYSYREIKDNSNNSNGINSDYLNEHENGDLTINMGVSAGYRINKYFSVNSGLNLFSSSINFQGNNGILDFDTVNNDLQVETSSGEYTINESDFNNEDGNNEDFNQNNDETIQIDYINNQHLKYIQIPLNFSFGIQKNKFRYFINSGIAYNRLVSDKNTFTTNGFSTVRSSNLNLVSKTNITQTIELGLEYLIQPNMSITCSPTFTSSLININKSSTIQSKPYWLGLNFSLNYFIK